MTMHKAFNPRDDLDNISQEKKEEEYASALTIASMHQYDNSKTT